MKFLTALDGWKTYICVVLIIVSALLKHFDVLDSETFKTVLTILGGLGMAAIKSGQNRVEKATKELTRTMREVKNG